MLYIGKMIYLLSEFKYGFNMRSGKPTILVLSLILLSIFLTTVTVENVAADGGYYIDVDYTEHLFVPSQKAAILWDGTNDTMILSTKVSSNSLANFAWVIPIPSNTPPEVTKGEIYIFNQIAENLGEYKSSKGGETFFSAFITVVIIFILGLVLLIIAFLLHKIPLSLFLIFLFVWIVAILFFGVYAYIYASGMIGAGGYDYESVEVIEMKQVDIYDVAILQATNATNLVDWLNDNNFIVPTETIPVLQEYCDQDDFYFVVNKINLSNQYTTPSEIEQATQDLEDGIATPLKISFQPSQPFYPMQMTSINEGNTKIHVYFISNHHVQDNSGFLSIEKFAYKSRMSIMYSQNIGDYITWLTYEGSTQDLTGDSYFVEND